MLPIANAENGKRFQIANGMIASTCTGVNGTVVFLLLLQRTQARVASFLIDIGKRSLFFSQQAD